MKKERFSQNKKIGILIFTAIIICAFLFMIQNVKAIEASPELSSEIKKQIGVDITKIPTAEEVASRYSSIELTKLIENNSVVGPIHKFFKNNQAAFKFIFAEEYSVTATFLLVAFFWFICCFIFFDLADSVMSSKGSSWTEKIFPIIIGLCSSIILAQIGVYRRVASWFLYFSFSKESAVTRIILWVLFIGLIIVLGLINHLQAEKIRFGKKKNKERELEHETKRNTSFREGAEQSLDSSGL